MKPLILSILSLFTLCNVSFAQAPITDAFPTATIYTFDYQTNQETLATSDDAILFKDALIVLVTNTNSAKATIKIAPGHKTFVITQADPKDGNAYQITYQSVFMRQTIPIYTFLYNADQNTLSYFNKSLNDYTPEVIQGTNVVNLNNCQQLSKFNDPNAGQPEQAAVPPVPGGDQQQSVEPVDSAVTTNVVPPALPDYDQPECPTDGYLWQPGYWAYSPAIGQYYWVPGAWVAPPDVGVLWTPPYWGFVGGVYAFHVGYWGPTIGFYGGINYGYGYAGVGFVGGGWSGGHFRYNTAVVHVNTVVIHNTYVDNTVVYRGERNRAAFNGRGGIMARPTPHEMAAAKERHIMATPEQRRNMEIARDDKRAGRPTNFAVQRVPERTASNERPAAGGRPAGAAAGRPGAPVTGGRPGAPGASGALGATGARQGSLTPGNRPGAPAAGGRPGVPGVPSSAGGRPGAAGRPGLPGGGSKLSAPAKAAKASSGKKKN